MNCVDIFLSYPWFQAHDSSVRAMQWSPNDQWMLTGDHNGFVKYWQSNMNNVKMYQAHKDPIRGLRCVNVENLPSGPLSCCHGNCCCSNSVKTPGGKVRSYTKQPPSGWACQMGNLTKVFNFYLTNYYVKFCNFIIDLSIYLAKNYEILSSIKTKFESLNWFSLDAKNKNNNLCPFEIRQIHQKEWVVRMFISAKFYQNYILEVIKLFFDLNFSNLESLEHVRLPKTCITFSSFYNILDLQNICLLLMILHCIQ